MTNADLAAAVRDLHDYLVVAGYEEAHAARYLHIARSIESSPEDVNAIRREARLTEIPGVGKTIAMYLRELLDTGTCSKIADWEPVCPRSVLELTRIPGLGVRTVRRLFLEFGIADLAGLRLAREAGMLGFLTRAQIEAIDARLAS